MSDGAASGGPPGGDHGTASGAARRLFVLAVALAMMTALSALRVDTTGAATNPMTLAAIGFVLLTAFTVGELGAALGLPKVTGYIVAGVLLGPQAADVLSGPVVEDMRMFNTLALGLIATTAGLELDLPAIRKVSRTLAATVGTKIVLLPLFVGLPVLLAERWLPSFGLSGWGQIGAFALVVSVLGIGTSPAIALAVVNDSGSRGRLTDLLLSIAVVKDLVVVTCLAVAIAISRSLLSGGALDASVLTHLGMELGSSILVGSIVGGLLILYFRFVRVEPLFSILVTILLVAEVSHTFHLELLLVFITAGFLVRNFSSFEHELLHPLERISLPVFVVFFTTAGAGIDLRGTLAILPLAISLVVLRAAAYFVAGVVGSKVGGEQPAVAKNAWLTWLPQAGVTLGLVMLAARALPELEGPITRLGLALVALNLLVGPVTLSLGLGRAGETAAARARAPGAEADAPEPTDDQISISPEYRTLDEDDPTTVESLGASLRASDLSELVLQLGREMESHLERYRVERLEPMSALLQRRGALLLPQSGDLQVRIKQIRELPVTPAALRDGSSERDAAAVFDALAALLRELPWTVEVPMDAHLLGPNAADGRLVALQRWGKRQLARLVGLRGRTLQREVPVQLALRCILEPLLAEALVGVSASLHRAEAELMTAARQGLQPEGAAEPGAATATAQRWFDTANADLRRALLGGLNEGVALLSRVGSPGSPSRGLRFANVERQVASALTHLAEDAPQWADRCEHAEDALKAAAAVAGIGLVLRQGVDHRARGPLLATRSEILPDLDEVATRLEALAVEAAALDPAAFELDTLEQLGTRCADALSEHSAEQMKRSSARFRRRTQAGLLVQDLAEVVRTTPATTVIISRHTPVARATRPRQVHTRELNLARLVDAQLHDELLPAVARALGPVTELVAVCEERAREGVSVASYGAHLAARGGFEAPEERRAVLVDAIQRGGHRVRRLHDELRAALGDSERALDEAQQRSAERLNALLDVDGVRPDTLVRNTLRATLGEATGALRRLRDVVVARGGALAGRARAISQDKNVRDLRIRSGRERLDATAIRDYLDTHLPPAERRGLPPTYVRLMAPGPVSERRMFVAREPLLEHLLDSLRAEPARATPSTLLVGPVGAGRTSLLQMVQMHLVGPRVLWLDHAFAARGEGPLVALGTELGVSGELSLVREALRARPTVVILDAVERWVEPGQLGVAALDELFELMDATVPQTRWLMSMNDAAFVIFDEAMQLRQRVSRLITLEPLSWEALQSIIELRAQQAGFDAVYGAEGWRGRLRERLRPGREKEDYFRDLARASRGVAGDALRLHLASASPRDAHSLRFSTPALTALPFVGQLTPEVLALLGALLRFGPLDPPRMARLLGQDDAFLASRLGFLLHAGLVRLKVQSGSAIVVSPFVAHALRRELEDMAILPRSAP